MIVCNFAIMASLFVHSTGTEISENMNRTAGCKKKIVHLLNSKVYFLEHNFTQQFLIRMDYFDGKTRNGLEFAWQKYFDKVNSCSTTASNSSRGSYSLSSSENRVAISLTLVGLKNSKKLLW